MYVERELERLYVNLNEIVFDSRLPRVAFTISAAKTIKTGWYVRSNDKTYQIIVNYGNLLLDVNAIYLSMLHQMVHIYCSVNNIKDTCRYGQYHNTRYKKMAQNHGLILEFKPNLGYYTIEIEPELKSVIHEKIVFSQETMRSAIERDEQLLPKNKRYGGAPISWICPGCKRTVKARPNTKIICGYCFVDFIPKGIQKKRKKEED